MLSGHKAFIAMLHVEVTQNNPIVLSFIDLLSQGALKRRAAAEISPETPLYMVEGGNMTTIEGRHAHQYHDIHIIHRSNT